MSSQPTTIAYVNELAKTLFNGSLRPAGVGRWEDIAVRILAGYEIGLKPIQSVNQIMVVNGRAVIWGDAALALVRGSGQLESIAERIDGAGENRTAVCVTKRKGESEEVATVFGVSDAKTAKLWGKTGPWTQYPDRMLKMRARSWAMRDCFGDILAGLGVAEEVMDYDVKPEPVTVRQVVDQKTLELLAARRTKYFHERGVNTTDAAVVKAAWVDLLKSKFGLESAKDLSPEQATDLLAELATPAPQPITPGEFFCGPEAAAPITE